ncbi:MAG: hypothetical protein IJD97_05115 [Clostridia bacterium]|nr:hypothetical protein [Clostridia bacterium]
MIKHEGISWILDRPSSEIEELKSKYPDHKEYLKHLGEYKNECYKRNIDFVHSLGLKCDCVGWSYIDPEKIDVYEILDKIEEFCKNEGFLARGGYGCSYDDFESDWYCVNAPEIDDVDLDKGEPYGIYAYKCKNQPLLLGWHRRVPSLVSEKFRKVCIENNIGDINFCWAKDVGMYDSVQYAFMYPENRIKTVACNKGLRYSEYAGASSWRFDEKAEPYMRLRQLGGYLPRLSEVFYDFQFNLPDYYLRSEFPKTGFAFIGGSGDHYGVETLLVHKDTAEILIKEGVLDKKMLHPALIYDGEIPKGYVEAVIEDRKYTPFSSELAEKMEEEYRKIKAVKRPKRKATEKMALKALRDAKREAKENFSKKIKKDMAEKLLESEYAPLVPYFLVADGGWLNDEYKFLSFSESEISSAEYREESEKEELSETESGIVFSKGADGDNILLTEDGRVVRISHECPEIIEEWSSPAQFFVDATALN